MRAPSRSGEVLLKLFAAIGIIATGVFFVFVVALASQCGSGSRRVASKTIVEIDLDRALAESTTDDPLAKLTGRSPSSFRDVVDAIERATDDERVAGLVVYLGGTGQGMARTQELRDAVSRFRETGKFAVAFSETFGELGPGNQSYYLATAFDEVWLQPTGALGLVGLSSETMFVKETLDKLEVQAQGDQRREYKNAYNMYTQTEYTEAHREAAQSLIDDLYRQMVEGIAERRGLEVDAVRAVVDEGPYVGPAAKERGLVDHLGYRDEAIAAVKERAGEGARLMYAHAYLKRAGRPHDKGGRKVALIHGVGGVMRGASRVDPFTGSSTMGSDTVTAAFRAAIEDDDVVAIVFRVDSPGGSAVASDAIWRETMRAKEAGKPVIVSMGNVAGSGGYYVAAGADKIVAEPGTITGSIGVFAGKPVARALWKKVGVTWDSVSTARNADMFSTIDPYDDAQWHKLQEFLDWVYVDFKQRVAEGRSMSAEDVEAIAKGRVWTGAQAKERGLVDELGGLATAVRLAREAAELEEDERVELVRFPKPKGLVESFFGDPPTSSEDLDTQAESEVSAGLQRWRSAAARLETLGLGPDDRGALIMAPIAVTE